MDFTSPLHGFMRHLDAAVVATLARTEEGLTGRRIEALIGSTSRSGLSAALTRLQRIGLIDRTDLGNASIFRINRAHVFWDAIERILAAPAIVEQEVQEYFHERYPDAVTVAIFGSVARREAGLDSDLDLAIVALVDTIPDREAWGSHLVTISDHIRRRTGSPAQIVDIDLSQLRRMVRSSDPLIASWRADAKTILGPDLRTLIREAHTT